jgi:hypothetical protein
MMSVFYMLRNFLIVVSMLVYGFIGEFIMELSWWHLRYQFVKPW